MTDTKRIEQARRLVAEIGRALDFAELGIQTAHAAGRDLREASLVAAMLAAGEVVNVLGGRRT